MEQYGKVLLIAMPLFLVAVLFEKWYGVRRGRDTLRTMDTISSLSSGVTNVVKDVLGLSVSILTYGWMVRHLAVMEVRTSFWTYAVAFVVLDFQGYWVHRWSHEINIFWNKHAIHHSSEDFNLACALRQSISSFVNLFTFFLLPAALLGVAPQVIAVVAPLHLFAQFWYHTEHIDKMGWWEKIIVTPSHHRVHHALNREYLDRNYGQVFILWDKLFGTFQAERPDVPPVYGITRPARTWNPVKINFQHLLLLLRDAWRTRSWRDRARIWFMPTGWRPADVVERFPLDKIDDPYNFEKYEPQNSRRLKGWAWVQFSATLLLVFYLFGNLARIGSPQIFFYGGFIILSIYAFTELMDRNPAALAWEALKDGLGLYWIWYSGDWFEMNRFAWWASTGVALWFGAATVLTTWLVVKEILPDARNPTGLRWSW